MKYKIIGWGGRIRTYDTRYQKPMPYHLATPQSQTRRNVAANAGAIKPEQNRIPIICPFIPGQCRAGWPVRASEPGRNRPDAVPRKGLGGSGGIIAIVKQAETGRPAS